MTEKVKRYLELWKNIDSDFAEQYENEYNKICEERTILRNSMTIEELKSLESHVHKKSWAMAIKPLIEAKSSK